MTDKLSASRSSIVTTRMSPRRMTSLWEVRFHQALRRMCILQSIQRVPWNGKGVRKGANAPLWVQEFSELYGRITGVRLVKRSRSIQWPPAITEHQSNLSPNARTVSPFGSLSQKPVRAVSKVAPGSASRLFRSYSHGWNGELYHSSQTAP